MRNILSTLIMQYTFEFMMSLCCLSQSHLIVAFLNSCIICVFLFSFRFQGDYIKHPVLFELSHKYGFTDNFPESALPNRLEEIKEAIRREIRKELKVSCRHR